MGMPPYMAACQVPQTSVVEERRSRQFMVAIPAAISPIMLLKLGGVIFIILRLSALTFPAPASLSSITFLNSPFKFKLRSVNGTMHLFMACR